jgi:uncharacterized protein YndB with AHSA1/START domain
MKMIEASITIKRSIDDVFMTIADFDSHASWRSGLIDAALTSEGPIKTGTTYLYNMKVMGREIETSGQIESFTPPTSYAWKATSGPFPMSGSIKCESVPEGTRVTDIVEAEPGGFFKLAEPLIIKQQQSQMEKDLKQLKALLEK